jgi:hypothetical protein
VASVAGGNRHFAGGGYGSRPANTFTDNNVDASAPPHEYQLTWPTIAHLRCFRIPDRASSATNAATPGSTGGRNQAARFAWNAYVASWPNTALKSVDGGIAELLTPCPPAPGSRPPWPTASPPAASGRSSGGREHRQSRRCFQLQRGGRDLANASAPTTSSRPTATANDVLYR